MAEITKTEITVVEDNVGKLENGTARQRYVVHVRGTTASVADTLNLATYVKNISGIEGARFESQNGVAATASTWSSTTITFAGHTGSGVYVGEWVVYN